MYIYTPVNQGVPHAGCNGRRLCSIAQSEDTLDDGHLCACGVQTAERAPVIHHHSRGDDLTAPVHGASLNRKSALVWLSDVTFVRGRQFGIMLSLEFALLSQEVVVLAECNFPV